MTTELYEIKVSESGVSQVTTKLSNLGDASKKAVTEVDLLQGGVRQLASILTAFLSINVVGRIIDIVDELGQLNSRIKIATASTNDYVAVQKELYDIANRSYKPIKDVGELFVRSAVALRQYGYSNREVLAAVEAFNGGLVISQASTERSKLALDAWSKAIVTGKIGLDEWKSLLQSAPAFMDELQIALEKTPNAFRKMAADGELSVIRIMEALKKATPEITKKLDEMPVSFADAIVKLKNSIGIFFDQTEQSFGIVSKLVNVVQFLSNNIDGLAIALISLSAAAAGFLTLGLLPTLIALVNPINIAIIAFTTLATSLSYFRNDIKLFSSAIVSLGDVVIGIFKSVIESVKHMFGFVADIARSAINDISIIFSGLSGDIQALFSGLYTSVTEIISGIEITWVDFFGFIGFSIDKFLQTTLTLVFGIKNLMEVITNGLKYAIIESLNQIIAAVQQVTGWFGRMTGAMGDWFGKDWNIDTSLGSLIDTSKLDTDTRKAIDRFKNSYQEAGDAVGKIVETTLVNSLSNVVDNVLNTSSSRIKKELVASNYGGVSNTKNIVNADEIISKNTTESVSKYSTLIKELNSELMELQQNNLQLSHGFEKLNQQETLGLKTRAAMTDGTLQLTASQKAMVEGLLTNIVALSKENEALEYNNNLIKDRKKYYDNTISSMIDENAKLREQNILYGLSESAINKVKRSQTALTVDQLKNNKLRSKSEQEYIDFLTETLHLLDDQINLQSENEALKGSTEFWKNFVDIGNDAFTSVFQSGKDLFSRLGDYLQTSVMSVIQDLVIKPISLRVVTSVAGAGVASSIFGSSAVQAADVSGIDGAGIGSGIMSFFTSDSIGKGISEFATNLGGANSWLSNTFSGASTYGNFAYGAAGLLGGLGGGLIGNMIGGKYGSTGGSLGATIGLAAAGPIGAVVGTVLGGVVGGLFGKGGGPKSGGSYADWDQRFYTPKDSDDELANVIGTLKSQVAGTSALFGTRNDYQFGLGFDTDPEGTAKDRITYAIRKNNELIVEEFNKEVERGEASAAISDTVLKMYITAFKDAEVPAVLSNILNSFNIDTSTTDELTRMSNAISGAAGLYANVLKVTVGPAVDAAKELQANYEELGGVGAATAFSLRELISTLDLTDVASHEAATELLVFASEISNVNNQLLQSVGISAQNTLDQFLAGFSNYENADAAAIALADSVIGSMQSAFLGMYAQQINSIMLDGVISPVINAILTGSSVSQALSQANIQAAIMQAKAAASAFSSIWNDPGFQEILSTLHENVYQFGTVAYSGFNLNMPALRSYNGAMYQSSETIGQATKSVTEINKSFEELRNMLLQINNELARFGETPIVKQANDLTESYTTQISKLKELGATVYQTSAATELYNKKMQLLLETETKASYRANIKSDGFGTEGFDLMQSGLRFEQQLTKMNTMWRGRSELTIDNLLSEAEIYWSTLTDLQKATMLDTMNIMIEYKTAAQAFDNKLKTSVFNMLDARGKITPEYQSETAGQTVNDYLVKLNAMFNTSGITLSNLEALAIQYWDTLNDIQKSAIIDISDAMNIYITSLTAVYSAQLKLVQSNYDAVRGIQSFSKNIKTAINNILIASGRVSAEEINAKETIRLKSEAEHLAQNGAGYADLIPLYEEILNLTVQTGETQISYLKEMKSFVISISDYIKKLTVSDQNPAALSVRLNEAKKIALEYYNIITGVTKSDAETQQHARQQLTGSVDILLQIAREMFASSVGYVDIYNEVIKLLTPLTETGALDTKLTSVEQQINDNVDSILSELFDMLAIADDMHKSAESELKLSLKQLDVTNDILVALGATGVISNMISDLPFALSGLINNNMSLNPIPFDYSTQESYDNKISNHDQAEVEDAINDLIGILKTQTKDLVAVSSEQHDGVVDELKAIASGLSDQNRLLRTIADAVA